MADDGEISVRFSSKEDASLWQAFTQVVNKARQTGEALDQAGKKGERLSATLISFADEVKSLDDGALRRLTAEHDRLAEAVKHNLLNEQEFAAGMERAQAKYQAELRKSRQERDKLAESRTTTGADGLPATAEVAKQDPLAEYNAELARLNAQLETGAINQEVFRAASAAAASEYAIKTKAARDAAAKAAEDEAERTKQAAEKKEAAEKKAAETAKSEQEAINDYARREWEKSQEAHQRFADELARHDSTPLERHTQRMEKLNAAARDGAITQEKYNRAAKNSHDIFQDELRQSQAEVDRLAQKNQKAIDEQGTALGNLATSTKAAWAAVAGTVYTVLAEINRATQEAADKLKATQKTTGTIAQIATSQAEFNQLKAAAQQLVQEGAAANVAEAESFVVSMANAGAMNELDAFAKLRKFGIMESPEKMIAAAAGLETSMGKDKIGSKLELVNRAFVAGGASPDTAEAVLRAAGKAGVAAEQQGASVDEVLALTSILGKAKSNADSGGELAKEFFSRLAMSAPATDKGGRVKKDSPLSKSFRGMSLRDILQDQELAGMSPAQLQKAFGSQQFGEALGIAFKSKDELLALLAATEKAPTQDLLGQKAGYVQGNRGAMATINARQAAGELELVRQKRAERDVEAEAASLRLEKGAEQYGQQAAERKPGLIGGTFAATPGLRDAGLDQAAAGVVTRPVTAEMGAAITGMGAKALRTFSPELFMSLMEKLDANSGDQSKAASEIQSAAAQMQDAARVIKEAANSGPLIRRDFSSAARRDAAAQER